MPYDPQRSHRRPQVSDDGPAPIDALLDHAEAADTEAQATEPEVSAAEPVSRVVAPQPAPVFDEIEVTAATERGRSRLALLAVALLVVVLIFAWVRRRR